MPGRWPRTPPWTSRSNWSLAEAHPDAEPPTRWRRAPTPVASRSAGDGGRVPFPRALLTGLGGGEPLPLGDDGVLRVPGAGHARLEDAEPGEQRARCQQRARRDRTQPPPSGHNGERSEEHTSELQSRQYLVCRLLLEKKKNKLNPSTLDSTSSRTQLPFRILPSAHLPHASSLPHLLRTYPLHLSPTCLALLLLLLHAA